MLFPRSRLRAVKGFLFFMGSVAFACCLTTAVVFAQTNPVSTPQEQAAQDHVYLHPQVLSSWQIADGETRIYLWGVEPIENNDALFKLKARAALTEKIGEGKVTCTLKSDKSDFVLGQCVNSKNEDLSLYMLQQGYVLALRSVIYGTIYEKPYIAGEESAQDFGVGAWHAETLTENGESSKVSKNIFLAAILFLIAGVLGLGFISFHIMRGFGRIVDVQNKTMDLAVKERHLKDKERFIVASMLDSEVRENKNKIEAYLVVYEEVFRDLSDKLHTPKYKQTGDIIQRQPALSRSVFDGNTDRLDLMGEYMASDIIHYYARIKTIPDYVELNPDTPIEDALKIVRIAVDQAQKLNELSQELSKKFVSSGLVKREE